MPSNFQGVWYVNYTYEDSYGREAIKCPQCLMTFASASALYQHKKRKHTETEDPVGEEDETVPAAETEESSNCIVDGDDKTYAFWIKRESDV